MAAVTSLKDLTAPGRTTVMGIVNVTEDSFSDGGQFLAPEAAAAHAHELAAAGADIIDIGAESTRPGATRVAADVEAARVSQVLSLLHDAPFHTSVDTMRASTALAAAEAGVDMINDVSGGLADPDMYKVMAETGLPVCLMHWRTDRFESAAGSADHGGDVVRDVMEVLERLAANAVAAGVDPSQISVDPGLGFAKTAEENWALLNALPEFVAGEFPVLVGASRKRFLAAIRAARRPAGPAGGGEAVQGVDPVHPVDADPATAAVTALAAQAGAWCVRVHDVAVSRDAVDVAAAWKRGGGASRG